VYNTKSILKGDRLKVAIPKCKDYILKMHHYVSDSFGHGGGLRIKTGMQKYHRIK